MVLETVGNLAVFLWSWSPITCQGWQLFLPSTAFLKLSSSFLPREPPAFIATRPRYLFLVQLYTKCSRATIRSPTQHPTQLFFFTVNSTASGLLVWKRLEQIQDVLPFFTLNNQLGIPYFSQWFKCFLSRRKFFILENTHNKRKTIKYALDIFSVSFSEVKCSVWMQENGWNGKVLQVMNSQCRQKLKYLYYTILHYHNTSHYASTAVSGSDLHCWVNLVFERWHHIRCYGNFPSFAEQKALLTRCGFVISASLGKGATHLPAEDFIMFLVGNN